MPWEVSKAVLHRIAEYLNGSSSELISFYITTHFNKSDFLNTSQLLMIITKFYSPCFLFWQIFCYFASGPRELDKTLTISKFLSKIGSGKIKRVPILAGNSFVQIVCYLSKSEPVISMSLQPPTNMVVIVLKLLLRRFSFIKCLLWIMIHDMCY